MVSIRTIHFLCVRQVGTMEVYLFQTKNHKQESNLD